MNDRSRWHKLARGTAQLQQEINNAGLGDPKVAEIESLRIQLTKAAESSEHWYRLWTEQGEELERLRGELTRRRLERKVIEQDLTEALKMNPTTEPRAVLELLTHALEQTEEPL